jgi:hypothetical protein
VAFFISPPSEIPGLLFEFFRMPDPEAVLRLNGREFLLEISPLFGGGKNPAHDGDRQTVMGPAFIEIGCIDEHENYRSPGHRVDGGPLAEILVDRTIFSAMWSHRLQA